MVDLLTLLWPHMELLRPLFSHDWVQRWPAGALDRLQTAGYVKPAETAQRVICPGCYEGHIEDVVTIEQPDGSYRLFVYCPEVLRAEVSVESLRQWTIDFEQLAGTLAKSMSLQSKCLLLLPGRLWRLGKATWRGELRDVLLARGLIRKDVSEMVARIRNSRRPIVLVGKYMPPNDIWENCEPAVVPLSEVASLDKDRLVIDAATMAAIVADADAAWDDDGGPLLDEQQLRRLLRAQRDSELKDDVLVAAYKQYGSYRKAADALIAQGVETDRWAIERAIGRAGGAAALQRSESSLFVVHAQASQRRGGRRMFQNRYRPK